MNQEKAQHLPTSVHALLTQSEMQLLLLKVILLFFLIISNCFINVLLFFLDLLDDESAEFDDDALLNENLEKETPEAEIPDMGAVQSYLIQLKDCLISEIGSHGLPNCYRQGSFWIRPIDPYFAMRNALASSDPVNPTPLYQPVVFL